MQLRTLVLGAAAAVLVGAGVIGLLVSGSGSTPEPLPESISVTVPGPPGVAAPTAPPIDPPGSASAGPAPDAGPAPGERERGYVAPPPAADDDDDDGVDDDGGDDGDD